MKRRARWALLAAGALVAAGVAVSAGTSPAWACNSGPGGSGTGGYQGTCPGSSAVQFGAEIVIPSSISFTTDVQPVSFNTANGTDQFGGSYHVYENSNDAAGVTMFLAGPPGGVFNTEASGATQAIPDTFVSAATIGGVTGTGAGSSGACSQATANNQTAVALKVGGAQFALVGDGNALTGTLQCAPNTPTGWDSFSLAGLELNSIPGGLPAGSFNGALTMSQWGN